MGKEMENIVTTDAEGLAPHKPPVVPPLVCGQPCGTPSATDGAGTDEHNESEGN